MNVGELRAALAKLEHLSPETPVFVLSYNNAPAECEQLRWRKITTYEDSPRMENYEGQMVLILEG